MGFRVFPKGCHEIDPLGTGIRNGCLSFPAAWSMRKTLRMAAVNFFPAVKTEYSSEMS